MGAGTYIGNAPNFMVRAIAQQVGIKMPSFIQYMLYASLFTSTVKPIQPLFQVEPTPECFDMLYLQRRQTNSTEHLITPVLEVSIPLLRCFHCNVYAYHDTVKQLAKNRAYKSDHDEPRPVPIAVPYWRRMWLAFVERFTLPK